MYKGKTLYNKKGLFLGSGLLKRLTIPFRLDLNTWYKNIINNDFAEKINNLPAKILPRVFVGDGSAEWNMDSAITFDDGDIVEIKIVTPSAFSSLKIFAGQDSSANNYLAATSTAVICRLNGISKSYSTTVSSSTEYVLRFERKNSGDDVEVFKDGISLGTQSGLGTDTQSLDQVGCGVSSSHWLGKIIYFKKTGAENWIFNGLLDYTYDISVLANHLTGTNLTTVNVDYDLEGSRYSNDNGYSLWQKAGSDDIQSPFDVNGNALSLTPGVDIPTGYEWKRDLAAGGSKHNIYDSMVGFNEDKVADSELEIFDRSNTTRQTTISRASLYYDSTDLATKSRYQINEIADPRKYTNYFQIGYKGKLLAKIRSVLNGLIYDLIRYDEQTNYGTDKTGSEEWKAMQYCGLDVFAIRDVNNQPLTDAHGYIIII